MKSPDKVYLTNSERLKIEMAQAYENGISPYHFRKSEMADINFIIAYKDARAKVGEKKEREQKVLQAMENLKNGRSR